MKKILNKIKYKKTLFFFLILILIYKTIFNSLTAEYLIHKYSSKFLNGQLNLKVKKFSLFFGFVFENIMLDSSEEFSKQNMVSIDKFALEYNIPLLLLGKISINEISLTNPKIHFFQKNGIWNFEKIVKPSESNEEKKEEEKNESTSNEIKTYIPISAFAKVFVKNLDFKMEAEKGKNFFYSHIQNFNFDFLFKTNRFTSIPLNLEALKIIDEFSIYLNKDKEISIDIADNLAKIKTDLTLFFSLVYESKNSKFQSALGVGSDKIPIKMKKGNVQPFQMHLGYFLNYIPNEDKLELKDFFFDFAKNRFFEAKGEAKNLTKPGSFLDFEIVNSKIDLDVIERITDTVPIIPPMNMTGILSLKPFTAKGNFSDLKITSGINGKKIILNLNNQVHSIPIFKMEFDSRLDLLTKEESSDANLLPILKILEIKNLETVYNGIILKVKGDVIPKSKVDLVLNLDKLILEKFTDQIYGEGKLNIHLKGSRLSLLDIDIQSYINGLRYKLGRGISGINNIHLDFKTRLDLKNKFQLEEIKTKKIELSLANDIKQNAVTLTSDLYINQKKGLIVEVKPISLKANLTHLIPTIPISLRNTISGLRTTLGNELSLRGDFKLQQDKSKKDIILNLLASLPSLELEDLAININTSILNDENETIDIEKISMNAFQDKFKGNFRGKFFNPKKPNQPFGDYTGELDGNLTLESDKPRFIMKGIKFQGDIDIDVHLKERYVKGFLKSNNSDFYIEDKTCKKDCKEYSIKGLKMNIPFLHDLMDKTTEELVDGNKRNFITTYGQDQEPNISIQSIRGTHPRFPNQFLNILKNENSSPGFSARIDYIENFLTIEKLKARSLSGFVYGKDILVNVGSGNPEKMEYEGVIQVRDIDLRELLSEESGKKIDDGKLRMDLNFKGKNLNDPISDTRVFFSTHYIGEDFGKSAIRIVNVESSITDTIIGLYKIDRIEVELNKGLVYAYVKLQKNFFSPIRLDNDQIAQERIPINFFIKRAESELAKKY